MKDPILLLSDPVHGLVSSQRPQQVQLTAFVKRAISQRLPSVAEAGTGVGKTYAYLLPLVQHVEENEGIVVRVSTAMKSLQKQMLLKDLPKLKELVSPELKFARQMGKGNYACARLVDKNESSSVKLAIYQDFFDRSESWVWDDAPDDIDLPVDRSRYGVGYCNKDKCEHYTACAKKGYIKDQLEAAEAQIIVVNHALIASDMVMLSKDFQSSLRGGKSPILVLDEAHKFPEVVREALSYSLDEYVFRNAERRFGDAYEEFLTYNEVMGVREQRKLLPTELPTAALRGLYTAMRREVIEERELGLDARAFALETRKLLESNKIARKVLDSKFSRWMTDGAESLFPEELRANYAALQLLTCMRDHFRMLEELAKGIDLCGIHRNSFVVGVAESGDNSHEIKLTPIGIGRQVASYMKARGTTPIYLSATLAHNATFDHFAREVGLDLDVDLEPAQRRDTTFGGIDYHRADVVGKAEYGQLLVGTPFDFKTCALAHYPYASDALIVGRKHANYYVELVNTILPLLEANEGHAFILFTSNEELRGTYEELKKRKFKYMDHVLAQGIDPRVAKRGRDLFVDTPHAVLLGLKTFWEGIDVQGEHLSLVIIPKLPFPYARDPVLIARQSLVEDSFRLVTFPMMMTDLRQMVGRLIRSTEDKGVLVILDQAMRGKPYGRDIATLLGFTNIAKDAGHTRRWLEAITGRRKRLAAGGAPNASVTYAVK